MIEIHSGVQNGNLDPFARITSFKSIIGVDMICTPTVSKLVFWRIFKCLHSIIQFDYLHLRIIFQGFDGFRWKFSGNRRNNGENIADFATQALKCM